MALNFQHLRAFHAVATCGSFSRAARHLNISQPTLSQQVKALEARYRTALFERRHQSLRLTPQGSQIFAIAQKIFALAEEAEELLGESAGGKAMAVRIGSDSPIYGARLAQALLALDPMAGIEVQIENCREVIARLNDSRVDVAIASDPEFDPRLFYTPLFVDSLRLVVPAGRAGIAAGGDPFPLARLSEECLLLREPSSKTRAATENLLNANDIRPRKIIELHSREAIREAVALGMGVSLFFASECPPDVRLATCEIDAPQVSGQTEYLVCSADRRRSPLMRLIIAAAESIGNARADTPVAA